MARNLGMVTAYAYAVAGGYTGTEAEFEELLGNIADDLSQIENLSVTVTTLTPGSSATASYSNGVLALGIPRGNTGATGNGISAIIKTGTSGLVDTYTVTYTNGQTMTYTVTNGAKGDTGNGIASIALTSTSGAVKTYTVTFTDGSTFTFDVTDGEVTNASLAEALEDFSANGTVANAEQLTTDIRANDQTPYLFRTSGGSVDIGDREYINGIVGGTVAFNQLAPIITGYAAYLGAGSTSGDTFIFTADNTTVANSQVYKSTPLPANHKYLSLVQIRPQKAVQFRLTYYGTSSVHTPIVTLTPNVWNTIGAVVSASASTTQLTMYPNINAVLEVGDTVEIKNFMVIDITLLFGSTIADYIYSLEQATAGAGVAFFKTLFPKSYYAYNAGELMSVGGLVSHDMVGFNAWDEEWEVGSISSADGTNVVSANQIRSKNYIPVIPNTAYYGYCRSLAGTTTGNLVCCYYDADKNFVAYGGALNGVVNNIPSNVHYIRLWTGTAYGNVYKSDICINLSWDGSEDGNYEPYQKWSYPLGDVTLRGIPKISNGQLYYDGDVYEADGTVTRKYGIVDLGTLNWVGWTAFNSFYTNDINSLIEATNNLQNCAVCSKYLPASVQDGLNNNLDKLVYYYHSDTDRLCVKDSSYTDPVAFKTAMSGVYLVYELATPTTETADPYTSPQIVNDFGTEEFVIDDTIGVPIPVGHNTDYPVNLKAKVEMAPNSPDGDGDYIVRQTNGTNEYVALANNATIQNILARLTALEG